MMQNTYLLICDITYDMSYTVLFTKTYLLIYSEVYFCSSPFSKYCLTERFYRNEEKAICSHAYSTCHIAQAYAFHINKHTNTQTAEINPLSIT